MCLFLTLNFHFYFLFCFVTCSHLKLSIHSFIHSFLPIPDLWEYYIPYLYSGISLFGVLLLLCKFSFFLLLFFFNLRTQYLS